MTSNTTPKHGRKFRVARAAAIIGVLAAAGFTGLLIAQSQSQSGTAAATDTALTVVESTTAALGTLTTTLDSVGNLEPIQSTTLTFATSAPITEVLVDIGTTVETGAVLATLDTTDGETQVRQSQLSVAQQQSSLDALLAPATDIELEQAQLSVESAQASVYSASSSSTTSDTDIEIARLQTELAANSLWQAQMNRDQQLEQAAARSGGEVSYSTELAANSSVDSAERSVTLSELQYEDTADGDSSNYSQIVSGQASLASAEANLAELQAGATEASVRLAEINLEQAQLNLESAERGLADYALVAPFSGVIAEQSFTVGMLPSSGSITLIDTSTFTLDVSIAEADIASIALGQKVMLSVQALPSAELTGTITHIDLIPGASSNGLVTYGATITLDPAPDVALRPGMSATASIILEQLDDVLLLPTRFLQTNETTGATTVMVQAADGTISEVTVTVGGRGASETEITSGLSAGQTVVLVADTSTTENAAAGGLGLGILGGAGGGQMRMEGGAPPSGAMPSGGPPSGG